MLAEIFLLQLENRLRAARDATTQAERFVPLEVATSPVLQKKSDR